MSSQGYYDYPVQNTQGYESFLVSLRVTNKVINTPGPSMCYCAGRTGMACTEISPWIAGPAVRVDRHMGQAHVRSARHVLGWPIRIGSRSVHDETNPRGGGTIRRDMNT